MVQRRDILLGVALLVAIFVLAGTAVLMLAAVSLDEPLITEPSVAVIDIVGGIYSSSEVVDQLERYIRHEQVPVIVIRMNTPGGGVAATQEIYETVLKAREAGKIVIASMGTVAASGGYYIAAACDTIMANPATVTGSIGVIATFPNLSGLYEKIGIGYETVKSGEFKDTGSTSREMTEHEREYLTDMVMDTFDQFIEAVAEHRNMTEDRVRELADGRVYTGRQAKENGLIDLLGTYQDAVDLAGEMAGIGTEPPVYREQQTGFWSIVSEGVSMVLARGFGQRLPTVSFMMDF